MLEQAVERPAEGCRTGTAGLPLQNGRRSRFGCIAWGIADGCVRGAISQFENPHFGGALCRPLRTLKLNSSVAAKFQAF